MAVVLKHFKWSPDGILTEYLRPGDERDFCAATTGLEVEGFISAGPSVAAAEALPAIQSTIETPAEGPTPKTTAADPAATPTRRTRKSK